MNIFRRWFAVVIGKVKIKTDVRVREHPNYFSAGVGDAFAGETYDVYNISNDTKPVTAKKVIWYDIGSGWVPDVHHSKDIVYLEVLDDDDGEIILQAGQTWKFDIGDYTNENDIVLKKI